MARPTGYIAPPHVPSAGRGRQHLPPRTVTVKVYLGEWAANNRPAAAGRYEMVQVQQPASLENVTTAARACFGNPDGALYSSDGVPIPDSVDSENNRKLTAITYAL